MAGLTLARRRLFDLFRFYFEMMDNSGRRSLTAKLQNRGESTFKAAAHRRFAFHTLCLLSRLGSQASISERMSLLRFAGEGRNPYARSRPKRRHSTDERRFDYAIRI
jgi:hypothetical protein